MNSYTSAGKTYHWRYCPYMERWELSHSGKRTALASGYYVGVPIAGFRVTAVKPGKRDWAVLERYLAQTREGE